MMDGENFYGGASYEPLDLFHYSAAGVRDFSGTTPGYASATAVKPASTASTPTPAATLGIGLRAPE